MAAFANFPYELVETPGEDALAAWEALRGAGRGAPVVLGEDDLDNLLAPFDPRERSRLKPVEQILAAADAIDFPDGLRRHRRDEHARAIVYLQKIASAANFPYEEYEAPLGDWPADPWRPTGLTVTYDHAARRTRPIAHIALIPTEDHTAIPAYMQWGNWNACPPPAFHVAALRAWRDLYGAELIGLGADTIDLRVARRPATRDEAVALAGAHYVYCPDIIDQGVGTLRALAAGLMASDWWFFWWD